MREYNEQAFTPEQVKSGELQDLLDYLLLFNQKSNRAFMDIHITSDGYCTIVEWTEVDYEQHECGRFQYVPSSGYVLREFYFPDNHTELLSSDEEFDERLKEWLEDNPGWVKTSYGTWTNEIENEKFRQMLEQDRQEEDTSK